MRFGKPARGRVRRYGIYAIPSGEFYRAGSHWLGWDTVKGQALPHPKVQDLDGDPAAITETPRRYGFHGTIKPPFHLAGGTHENDLRLGLDAFCATQSPVSLSDLVVRRLGTFIAIVPAESNAALTDLAAAAVAKLDGFRAPPTDTDLAERRGRLSTAQEANLRQWGYPYVMSEFRFHLTLTGRLSTDVIDPVRDALAAHFDPFLPRPFVIGDLCLVGETEDGFFHVLHRCALAG